MSIVVVIRRAPRAFIGVCQKQIASLVDTNVSIVKRLRKRSPVYHCEYGANFFILLERRHLQDGYKNKYSGLTLLFILNRFPNLNMVSHKEYGDNLCIVNTFRNLHMVKQWESGGKSVIRHHHLGTSNFCWPDYFIREEAKYGWVNKRLWLHLSNTSLP